MVSGPLITLFGGSAESIVSEAFDCSVIDGVRIILLDIFCRFTVGQSRTPGRRLC